MRDGEKYRLGDLCKIVKGETPIKQAIPGRYPLVVTAAARASHEAFQFDCRAVIVPLVSSTGHGHASIKRINYQEGKFALGSILCAVIPKDEKRLNAKFLHVYFSYFKDQLIVPLMKGSANVSLSIGSLAELKIIVPPMEVQMRVIALAENDELMKPLEHETTHQQSLLAKLKQAILQEAIQGKLTADWRAAHPGVEPASQLLKRIQAEKARLIAAKKLRPEKPLPQITPAEIPFEIPEGWEWCRLGSIAEEITKGSSPTWQGIRYVDESAGGILFVTSKNVGSGEMLFEKKSFVEARFNEIEPRSILQKNDILTNLVGASIARTALFDLDCVANINQAVAVIRIAEGCINKALLVAYMNSAAGVAYMLEQQFAPGRANLSLTDMAKMLVPLPPLAEQAAIVERVEALMTTCRALEAEIEQSRTHAAHLLQAVLKEAFAPAS